MANNWAIVVGINQYEFLPNASLKFAMPDALAMRAFLSDDAGFKDDRIMLCGDGTEGSRRATRAVLRDILLNKLQPAQNADNLWFFFSGHGMADHLMPIDGNPGDLRETAISISFVTQALRACKAKNIVLVLDMCRNENHDAGQKSITPNEKSLRELLKERDGQQGIITLFSCGQGESSYELAELNQGVFTYALLEGLRASQTRVKSLEAHLVRRVPELHKASGKVRQQVPLVIPEPGWKYDEPILSNYVTAMDVIGLNQKALLEEVHERYDEAKRLFRQIAELASVQIQRRDALDAIDRIDHKIIRQKQNSDSKLTDDIRVDLDGRIPDIDPAIEDQYVKLQKLLENQKWREADDETCNVMIDVLGGRGLVKNFKNYPQTSIEKIDRLWSEASGAKFGFIAQARIWQQVNRDKSEFDIQVGWKLANATKQINQSKLNLNLKEAEIGHFPAFFKSWGGGGWSLTQHLLDRVSECLDSENS